MPAYSRSLSALLLSLLSGHIAAFEAAAAPTASITPAGAVASEDTRNAFVAAMQRVRQNQPDTPDAAPLETYVIHDYLVAARLRRDLAQTPDASVDTAIDAFLQAHSAQPVARGLRRDWLASLAERRRWDQFLPRSAEVTDPLLVCYRLQGRLATGDTKDLGAAALARWLLPLKAMPECTEAFAWLRQQNLVTPALAETKVRAALAADNPRLARSFMADVPVTRTAALLQWSDLLEAPKSALTVLATHPSLSVEPEALAAGFDKFARVDSVAAANLLTLLLAGRELPLEIKSRLQRTAALDAAYDHDLDAAAKFDGLAAEAVDTQVEEWRVRAALWSGDYAKALGWIEHMPATLAAQPRWRYWRARAVAATAGAVAAAPLFSEIAGLRDFYGYLAADRLNRAYSLNARPSPDDVNVQAAMAADIGFIRAHELFACAMTDEAGVEWSAVVGGADPAVKVQAAHLASRWGWYAQSIATLAQAAEWDDVRLRYPRPFPDVVAEAARLAAVPADWIWGVMRQESLFRKDAVSRADARGLMQMLPSTAAAVARRWRLAPPGKEGLFEPSLAVPLGAAYLRELLDRNSGELVLGLAAYNAGSTPVARWRPSRSMDADVWMENIPYTETRAYVQHILEHIVAFAWVRDAEPPHLDALMPAVAPVL
ncbi:MAG: transglycosylase SLT domain-containing protein [Gammaproteobacteria bacterium]